ncbi:hypothetical protein HZH66_009287 [Vespula vulgaris]|uniref:Uncharacterized protein n=1 Tax=Vespula vulgaris TaxID=7454 RepID=A0A834JPB6_VESVU|nr:hypothetical protein HZH66_009287 [Vespula vulgaris]
MEGKKSTRRRRRRNKDPFSYFPSDTKQTRVLRSVRIRGKKEKRKREREKERERERDRKKPSLTVIGKKRRNVSRVKRIRAHFH